MIEFISPDRKSILKSCKELLNLFFFDCIRFIEDIGWLGFALKSIILKLISKRRAFKLCRCYNSYIDNQSIAQMSDSFLNNFRTFIMLRLGFNDSFLKRSKSNRERIRFLIQIVSLHFSSFFYNNARKVKLNNS